MTINNSTPPRLLTLKEMARTTGISYGALRDLHFRGQLPIVRVASRWYVERAEVDRFIARNREP